MQPQAANTIAAVPWSSTLFQVPTLLQATGAETSLTRLLNRGWLRKATQDCTLDLAQARTVAQCEWLAMGDLGLGQHAWACATMRPCRAMDEKGVADIHVASAACGMDTRALER
jgi:hypothetical protein